MISSRYRKQAAEMQDDDSGQQQIENDEQREQSETATEKANHGNRNFYPWRVRDRKVHRYAQSCASGDPFDTGA